MLRFQRLLLESLLHVENLKFKRMGRFTATKLRYEKDDPCRFGAYCSQHVGFEPERMFSTLGVSST